MLFRRVRIITHVPARVKAVTVRGSHYTTASTRPGLPFFRGKLASKHMLTLLGATGAAG